MRKVFLVLLLLTLAGWADDFKGKPDKAAPKGWLRYSFGSGPGLSIDLPSKPQGQPPASAGAVKSMKMYVSSGNQAVAVVEVIEFTMSVDTAGFRQQFFPAAFSEFKKSFEGSSHMKLKVLGRKAAKLGGLTGFEENYSSPTLLGRLRIVAQGKHGFLYGTFVPVKSPKILDQFVQSAQLTP